MQSKRGSLIEAIVSTAAGFVMSWVAGLYFYPLIGMNVTPAQNTVAVVFFTFLSLLRGFGVRRIFNRFRL